MLTKIPKLFSIPDSLYIAASQKKIVPFVGAGVSKLAGYPNWDEFASDTLKFFVNNGKFSYAQFDQISKLPSRVKLSLAVNLEERYKLSIDFSQILRPQRDRVRRDDDIYDHILKLSQFSQTFVTTNYDKELDKMPSSTLGANKQADVPNETIQLPMPIYKLTEIDVGCLSIENAVVHIHGSVCDRHSMVLTTSDYLARYYGHQVDGASSEENRFLTFLRKLFKSRNVLFIGYGLAELEVLEYVVQKGIDKQPAGKEQESPRHYVIQGFFSHELELAKNLEAYFQTFGVKLLPFSRDERDWHSLKDVIKQLNDTLPPGTRLSSTDRREMSDLIPKQ